MAPLVLVVMVVKVKAGNEEGQHQEDEYAPVQRFYGHPTLREKCGSICSRKFGAN